MSALNDKLVAALARRGRAMKLLTREDEVRFLRRLSWPSFSSLVSYGFGVLLLGEGFLNLSQPPSFDNALVFAMAVLYLLVMALWDIGERISKLVDFILQEENPRRDENGD
jgi:hypothetical protein